MLAGLTRAAFTQKIYPARSDAAGRDAGAWRHPIGKYPLQPYVHRRGDCQVMHHSIMLNFDVSNYHTYAANQRSRAEEAN